MPASDRSRDVIVQQLQEELAALDTVAHRDTPYARGIRCATDHLREWLADKGLAVLVGSRSRDEERHEEKEQKETRVDLGQPRRSAPIGSTAAGDSLRDSNERT